MAILLEEEFSILRGTEIYLTDNLSYSLLFLWLPLLFRAEN